MYSLCTRKGTPIPPPVLDWRAHGFDLWDGSNLIHVPIIPLVLYTMVIFWDEIQDTRLSGFEKSCPIPTFAPSMIIYAGTLDGSCT